MTRKTWEDLCKIHEDLWSINKILWFLRDLKICAICVICVPNKFLWFLWFLCARYLFICEKFCTFVQPKNIYIYATKFYYIIRSCRACAEVLPLMAEDPCLAPLTRLKRRTFLPSEVAKIYASLGHPWPPGPPPLWGGRERSPLWRRAKETPIFIRRNFHFPAMKQSVCLALHFRHTPGSRYWKRHIPKLQSYKVTKLHDCILLLSSGFG